MGATPEQQADPIFRRIMAIIDDLLRQQDRQRDRQLNETLLAAIALRK